MTSSHPSKLELVFEGRIRPGLYLLYKSKPVALVDAWAKDHDVLFLKLDGRVVVDKESLFQAFADGMTFPSYFGHNWVALTDSASDLS